MRIYVASSWRNDRQPEVVAALRAAGHEVYDFKNPEPGDHGFHWSEIDKNWRDWNGRQFATALDHPVAVQGFNRDRDALDWCEACVIVLPCGRSAHLEAGYAIGQGKATVILLDETQEPELMYKLAARYAHSVEDVLGWMATIESTYATLTDESTQRGYQLFEFDDGSCHWIAARSIGEAWDVYTQHDDTVELDRVRVRVKQDLDNFAIAMPDDVSEDNEPREVSARELIAGLKGPEMVAAEEWAD